MDIIAPLRNYYKVQTFLNLGFQDDITKKR